MTNSYPEFLARKQVRFDGSGVSVGNMGEPLFPFQQMIVRHALEKGRAAIFADCGLGKTIMQLEWATHVPGRVLVLTPLAVARQTESEARRFGYDAEVVTEKPGDCRISITNYHKLDRFDLDDFDAIVLDESSILKSMGGAMRTKLIRESARFEHRLACTATPSPNDFMELGNHSEFLGAMSRSEMLAMFFVHDGGSTKDWRIKGHARHEFWRWVSSWASLVTAPSDLGFSDDGFKLPALRFHRREVPSGDGVQEALIPGTVTLDMMGRRAARRDSMDRRCEAAASLALGKGQWLLWCDLNDESAMLSHLVPDAVEVKGGDSDEHKTEAMLGFAAGDVRVLVTKPRIAGFGMNWQSCHQMAFVGISDSYEALYQATRRCWRFGQQHPVDVHLIYSEAERCVIDNVLRKEAAHAEMQSRMVELAREAMVS